MAAIPIFRRKAVWLKRLKLRRTAKNRFKRWKIVTGDRVEVISGIDKNKQGEVLKVDRRRNKVWVEGLNLKNRVDYNSDTGGIITMPGPIHVSNVMLIDPELGIPTKVNIQTIDGKRTRVSKKSNSIIPKPTPIGLMTRKLVEPDDKTTAAHLVLEKTYDPSEPALSFVRNK